MRAFQNPTRLRNSPRIRFDVRLEVSYGNLPLRNLKVSSRLVDGKISIVNLRGPSNQPINGHKVNFIGDEVRLDLGQTILIARGTVLTFQLSRV
jgi:hypothetical protein